MKTKKILGAALLFVGVLFCFGVAAQASTTGYTGDCGTATSSVQYEFHEDSGWLEITGKGEMKDASGLLWRNFNEKITGVTIGVGVTYITGFAECENLVSVGLSEGVTTIGSEAFYGCISLESITIPASVYSITPGSFNACEKLIAVNVDEDNSYYSSVNGIVYDKKMHTLYLYPYGKTETSFSVPNGITYIGGNAFSGCDNIENIILPDGVLIFGESAFSGCQNLKSVYVPDSVTMIDCSAFEGCSGLEYIKIPSGVTEIYNTTFDGCTSLKSISIGIGVTSIGYEAFGNCVSLTDIYYEGNEYEWEDVYIYTAEWSNECLAYVTVHYDMPLVTTLSDVTVEEIEANYYSYAFKMRTPIATEGTFIFALYKDGKLVGCATETTAAVTLYTSSSRSIEVSDTPTDYKLFFWSSMADMTPLCEPIGDTISTEEEDDVIIIMPIW